MTQHSSPPPQHTNCSPPPQHTNDCPPPQHTDDAHQGALVSADATAAVDTSLGISAGHGCDLLDVGAHVGLHAGLDVGADIFHA